MFSKEKKEKKTKYFEKTKKIFRRVRAISIRAASLRSENVRLKSVFDIVTHGPTNQLL